MPAMQSKGSIIGRDLPAMDHEMKLIIEGELTIADDTGQTVTAVKGDLFYFPEGSTITFSTEEYGMGYFVGQRGVGEA